MDWLGVARLDTNGLNGMSSKIPSGDIPTGGCLNIGTVSGAEKLKCMTKLKTPNADLSNSRDQKQ